VHGSANRRRPFRCHNSLYFKGLAASAAVPFRPPLTPPTNPLSEKIPHPRGAHSGCDPDCGVGAVPACGLASRARAASGIMSAGITAGARGASAGLGQECAGNARKHPRPRKPGLKSKSRGLETSARAAVERREASAPEAGGPCKRAFRGARRARSANGWQQPLAWRGQFQFAPSGAPPPLILLEAKQQWLSFLLQNSGADASRERENASAPAIAGEGDRPQGGGGALAVTRRCRCRRMTAFRFFLFFVCSRKKLRRASFQRAVVFISSFIVARAPSTTLRALRAFSGGPPPPLARGRMREKGFHRAQTQRARAHIAKISRSLLCRPGAGGAGLLRLLRFLARVPLSAVPARPRLPRRLHRLHRRPPRRRGPPFRRGQGPRAGAHPERCRRAGASRLAERLLHRDLAA